MLAKFLYEVNLVKYGNLNLILDRFQWQEKYQKLYAWELYRRKKSGRLRERFGHVEGGGYLPEKLRGYIGQFERLEAFGDCRIQLALYKRSASR